MKAIMLAVMFTLLCNLSNAADVPAGSAPEWMKYTVPSENHKALNDFTGKWKFTMKFWMEPNGKAEESTGTSTNKWILGGRFIQQDVKSKMGKETFQGMGFTGYDTLRGEVQTVWLDTMSTHMMLGAGTLDTATSAVTTKGDFACAMSGNKTRPYRTELKKVSKNEHTYTMWMTGADGQEFKSMEITYKRG